MQTEDLAWSFDGSSCLLLTSTTSADVRKRQIHHRTQALQFSMFILCFFKCFFKLWVTPIDFIGAF